MLKMDMKKRWMLPVLGGMGLLASAATSQAALVLEFNEVGSAVVLSFSGAVDLSGAFTGDVFAQSPTFVAAVNRGLTLVGAGPTGGSGVDVYAGSDLLPGFFVSGFISGGSSLVFGVDDTRVSVGPGVDSNVAKDDVANVSLLSAEPGGQLFGKTQTFATTFADSDLDAHAPNTLIDMWRVTGTTGTDNLIQFRVNTAAVPEPSASLLAGLGVFGLLARRKRA